MSNLCLEAEILVLKVIKQSKAFEAKAGDFIKIRLKLGNTTGASNGLYAEYLEVTNMTTGFIKKISKNIFMSYLCTIEF